MCKLAGSKLYGHGSFKRRYPGRISKTFWKHFYSCTPKARGNSILLSFTCIFNDGYTLFSIAPSNLNIKNYFTFKAHSYFLSFFKNWGELPGNSGQVQEFLESLEKFAGILGGARNSMKGRWDNNCILLVNFFLRVFTQYWLACTKLCRWMEGYNETCMNVWKSNKLMSCS